MVTARFLGNKFVRPLIERHEAKGRADGRAEERGLWIEWNSRRIEAEAAGTPFDEPPPHGQTSYIEPRRVHVEAATDRKRNKPTGS